jgi:hypothetical protein
MDCSQLSVAVDVPARVKSGGNLMKIVWHIAKLFKYLSEVCKNQFQHWCLSAPLVLTLRLDTAAD